MAASGDFFTGDDLDELFSLIDGGFLDGDDSFNQDIESIAVEVAANEESLPSFKCNQCEKVCKSQRGLTRHINAKHRPPTPAENTPESDLNELSPLEISMKKLHPLQLKVIVKDCAEKVSKDMCFPLHLRLNFDASHFVFTNADAEKLWYKIRSVIDSYSNDPEKYQSEFFTLFLDNLLPEKFSDMTLTNTLMAEVSTAILFHLSGKNSATYISSKEQCTQNKLDDNEMKTGYIIHKLYTKCRFLKNSASKFNEQCCLILHICKIDSDDSQTLIAARDRGGLWKVSKKMQDIFVECEHFSRKYTSDFRSSIMCETLVTETMKNIFVISHFNSIISSVDTTIKKEISLNLLEHILTLYFRVRSFSYAKDVRERHKRPKKDTRKRSQRKELKQASI